MNLKKQKIENDDADDDTDGDHDSDTDDCDTSQPLNLVNYSIFYNNHHQPL